MGTPGSYDTRRFRVGEPVCVRNQAGGDIVTGTYVRPHPQPGTGHVYIQIIRSVVPGVGENDRWVPWHDVGKIPQPVSATATNVVVRNSPLPLHLASLLKKYGGKRRTKKRNHPQKKLKSRRRSRRN